MTDLEAIAKDAAERVHKNGGCVPQMAYAPILFALQDAFPAAPSPEPMQADLRETIAWLNGHAKGSVLRAKLLSSSGNGESGRFEAAQLRKVAAMLAAMQAKSEPVAWIAKSNIERLRRGEQPVNVYASPGPVMGSPTEALYAHPSPSAPNPDLAGLVERLEARTVERLAPNWREGLKCPECDADADRPKCMWDCGPSCPRLDPDAYEFSPKTSHPDPLCHEAAEAICHLASLK